jgi:hypothetical protein
MYILLQELCSLHKVLVLSSVQSFDCGPLQLHRRKPDEDGLVHHLFAVTVGSKGLIISSDKYTVIENGEKLG